MSTMMSLSSLDYHELKHPDFGYADMEVDGLMASQVSALLGVQNGAPPSPSSDRGRHATGTAVEYRSTFRPAGAEDDFMLGPVISGVHDSSAQFTPIGNPGSRGVGSINRLARTPTSATPVPPNAFTYASQPTVTAIDACTMAPQDMDTISPLHTDFDHSQSSYGSNRGAHYDNEPYSAVSSHSTFSGATDGGSYPRKRSSSSHSVDFDLGRSSAKNPSPKGRRRFVTAEAGSARAVYLEKNRKAASKCRTKQKKQQEELVETARDVERRNKLLKAEVEILKDDMRNLMGIVGQHSQCSDNRLQLYVQREADRLVARSRRSSSTEQSLPKSSASSPGQG